MTTQNARYQHAQRDTEALAASNLKKRELRWSGDTRRLVGKLQDDTIIYGDGYSVRFVDRFSTVAAAITAFGSSSIHAKLAKSVTLTANATLAATTFLDVLKGGAINLAGFTLTINGPFRAGRYQVFSGSGSVLFGATDEALPEWFGAAADGVTDDGAAINKAITSLSNGGTVKLNSGKTYAVNPGSNRIRVKSRVTLDLNWATIQRIGTNYSNNLIENYTYDPGNVGYDNDVRVVRGWVYGNGTNDTATQSHTVPAANIAFFGVNGFLVEDIKCDTANGDCLAWRLANDGTVNRFVGGSFGRNLFSPTNGLRNKITNCNFDFAGLTGAAPGAYIDVENDYADETSDTYWENCLMRGAVFVDFWTEAGGDFAHKARFSNCRFTGDSPRTLSIQSSNPTIARGFVIDDSCRIAVSSNTAAAVKILNVSGFQCNALLANDSGSQGSSKALWIAGTGSALSAASGGVFSIAALVGYGSFATKTLTITNTVSAGSETVTWTSTTLVIAVQSGVSTVAQVLTAAASPTGTPWAALALDTAGVVSSMAATAMASLTGYLDGGVEELEFNGRVSRDQFSSGLYAVDSPIKNSRFIGMFLGDVKLREGSEANSFVGCKIGVLEIIDSPDNTFRDCDITGTTTITTNTNSVTDSDNNDFSGCTMEAITFSGADTANNRFSVDTKINGALTFNSSSTWNNQYFENESGEFTPTITGSTNGNSVTHSVQWGRYNILGDVMHLSLAITWTANGGATGNQRINLNLPNSIVPAGASDPSRHAFSIRGNGFAFTGSQLVCDISGGGTFITPYGLDNAGTLTNVPATTAAGTYYLQGFFRIR